MVSMESPKRQGWRITVRAKSKGLDLRVAASNILPHWGSGGERISFFLRFRRYFFLRVKSVNQSPAIRVPAVRNAVSPLAKPFQFLKEAFRRRRWFSRKNVASRTGSKRSRFGSLFIFSKQHKFQGLLAMMIGSIFLLSHSAYQKYHKGIALHAFASLLDLIMLLRMGRIHLLLLLAAGVFASFGFSLRYLTYANYFPMIAWRVWNYIFTFGYSVFFPQLGLYGANKV
ncbi:hypothetical protein Cni_G23555 [Canna indica]|uniref:Uncharacterized protein n=1 Tax=Canna indica TaxID=4628 RepID=A0AAQ3QKJ8_9LILI|nr:hypothetical protein Cni_G23555 [Canna indica]